MIINISGRTDIVAFYMPWLIQRLKEKTVDVRNPFYPKQVSRIDLSPEKIDALVFCTKNPLPLLDQEALLKPYAKMFQITITPYAKEIEPHVIDKVKVIDAVKQLSNRYGKKAVQVRYDPIFLSPKYTIDFHEMMFERLMKQLDGSIDTIIISFIDMMKNTRLHLREMQLVEMSEKSMKEVAQRLSIIAQKYQIHLKTCAEEIDLSEFEIFNEPCFGPKELFEITGKLKKVKRWNARKHCDCIEMVDIGVYNTCSHLCRYCYANYDEKKIHQWVAQHDPTSSLLIGHLDQEDRIKIRK